MVSESTKRTRVMERIWSIHSIDPGNNHADNEQSLLHTTMEGNPIAFVSVARVVV